MREAPPPTATTQRGGDEIPVQPGLFWQEGVSGLSNGHLSTGEYTELSRLFVWMRNGGGFLPTTQVFRTEMYTYDANGNRATKTTAYGTITYSYDAENRLVKTCGDTGVGVEYAYDNNGNLLSQTSSLKHSIYEYNPQNRMVRSRVVDDEARTIASTRYGYDVLGRRTLVQDNGTTTLRTLYDGLSFDVVKESPVYSSGGFTDTYNTGIQYSSAGRATGERYRYLDDGATATSGKYQYIEDSAYQTVFSRYSSERTMLYAYGSPVAINRASGTRGYLGTDILGSTRSVTDNHGVQESYYDYDIFGSPITGNYATGADYGYLGKPYDKITGLYNYGYRDYSPQTVRFTTVDPIRDGANWFAYVSNDPVNYVDLWGLRPTYGATSREIDVPNVEYQWPTTEGRITSAFGSREDAVPNPHPGIDIAPMTPGQKGQDILSAENGTIIIVGMSAGGSSEIHIEHTNGELSIYKHHNMQSVQVKVGDGVYKREKIAEMSDVGSPGAVHLHFEIRPSAGLRQKDAIDPVLKLPDIPATIHLTEAVERSGNTLKNK